MTNQEAAEHLAGLLLWGDHTDPKIDEALKMAIKRLDCQEVSAEDCISRRAVIDTTICDGIACNECSFNKTERGEFRCLFHERVNALPAVSLKTEVVDTDCISRKDTVEKLIAISNKIKEQSGANSGARLIKLTALYLNNKVGFPTVQPMRKRGRWVKVERYDKDSGTIYNWKICSICSGDMCGTETNYCPNCGAEMSEEVEDEN